jgi:hypothetical protein
MSFIFVTVALDMLALGIIIPVWPTLVKSFTGLNDSSASIAIGVMSVLFAATQFFAAPILGVLSDRFGRRPVILFSNIGTALDYIIMALAPARIRRAQRADRRALLRRRRVLAVRLAEHDDVLDRHPDQRAVGHRGVGGTGLHDRTRAGRRARRVARRARRDAQRRDDRRADDLRRHLRLFHSRWSERHRVSGRTLVPRSDPAVRVDPGGVGGDSPRENRAQARPSIMTGDGRILREGAGGAEPSRE